MKINVKPSIKMHSKYGFWAWKMTIFVIFRVRMFNSGQSSFERKTKKIEASKAAHETDERQATQRVPLKWHTSDDFYFQINKNLLFFFVLLNWKLDYARLTSRRIQFLRIIKKSEYHHFNAQKEAEKERVSVWVKEMKKGTTVKRKTKTIIYIDESRYYVDWVMIFGREKN